MGLLDLLGRRKKPSNKRPQLPPRPLGRPLGPRPEPQADNNFIIITLDSLRWDSYMAAEPKVIGKLGEIQKRYSFPISTVNVGFAAYFEGLGRVGLMEDNKDDKSVFISGTKVREQLVAGEQPDPRIMRESTAKVLVDYYRSAGK